MAGRSSGRNRGRPLVCGACPRLTLFAPSKSRALQQGSADGNFRRPLVGSRRAFTSAEMAALRCIAAARWASSSPRSIRSQRESAVGRRTTGSRSSPLAAKTAPHASARHVRSYSFPVDAEPLRGMIPGVDQDRGRFAGAGTPAAGTLKRATIHGPIHSRPNGRTCCAVDAGTVRCRGRAFRGLTRSATELSASDEDRVRAAAMPFRINGCTTCRPVGFRRLARRNLHGFRKRPTLRSRAGQPSEGTLTPPKPSPFAGIEECPHFPIFRRRRRAPAGPRPCRR